MLSHVPVNFVPPNSEERSDNGKIDIFDSAHGNFAHRGETGETRPAKKIDQKRLDQIVGVMSEKNRLTAPLLRHFRKERITRFTRGGFDRHLSVVSDRADIRGSYFKIDFVFRGEFFDKARIGPGRPAAQLMVEMADDQLALIEIVSIWQFAEQPNRLPIDGPKPEPYLAPNVSHHQVGSGLNRGS